METIGNAIPDTIWSEIGKDRTLQVTSGTALLETFEQKWIKTLQEYITKNCKKWACDKSELIELTKTTCRMLTSQKTHGAPGEVHGNAHNEKSSDI
jgi:hypothetical protein